jgi:hypothetical protein
MPGFHCENPYPFVPDAVLDASDSVRASLPNRYCDPKIAARLFEETLDEYMLCDELGLNITSSEHHAGSTRSTAQARWCSGSSPGRPGKSGCSAWGR